MKNIKEKILISVFLIIGLLVSISYTYAFFNSSSSFNNSFNSKNYYFTLNGNGGTYGNTNNLNITGNRVSLPVPIRDGYAFAGYYDGINIVSNDITNIQNIEYVANWSTNTYKSNFYYGSNYIKSSYNLYNTMVTVPSISTEDLGLSSWFTYITGYVDTEGWIQKDHDMTFYISTLNYNCTPSFGYAGISNARAQLSKLQAAGYNFCYINSGNYVECPNDAYAALEIYNNAWNILPRSGSGFSTYKQISCDSGYATYQTR